MEDAPIAPAKVGSFRVYGRTKPHVGMVGTLLGLVVFVGGICLYPLGSLFTLLLVPLGLVLMGICGWLWRGARRRFCRIETDAAGAVFAFGNGRRVEVRFADLAAVSHMAQPWYVNGIHAGVRYRLQLWRKEDRPRKPFISIDCRIAAKKNKGETEGMQALGEAAVAAVTERFEAVIRNGGTVRASGGLQFDGTTLRCRETVLPVDEIADLCFQGGKFRIWRRGEEPPVLELAPVAANMLPIMELVRRRLPATDDSPTEGLGRLVFERRSTDVLGLLAIVAGIPFCLMGNGVSLVVYGGRWLYRYLRCHERGVMQSDRRGDRRLLYKDVATFSYSASNMHVNGAYVGTTVRLVFTAAPSENLSPITFSTTVRNADGDLEALRDRVAAVVGQRLLRQYAETGAFPWCQSLAVTRTGIRYRKGGVFGRKKPLELPFAEYGRVEINNGKCQLFAKNAKRPVLTCPVSQPNFFPGLYAFLLLVTPEEAEPRSAP